MSRSVTNIKQITFLLLALVGLTACVVSPPKKHPVMNIPVAFKESGAWKIAHPADHLPRGKWWELYHDSKLNALEEKVQVSNQSLLSSLAKAAQANALVRVARAAYYPTLNGNGSASRASSGAGGASSSLSTTGVSTSSIAGTSETLSLGLSWNVDVWGSTRHNVSATKATAEATESDVQSVLLSLQTQLAQDYFTLRVVDAQRSLLDREITEYKKSLELTQNRYKAGVAARQDVAQAEAQLAAARAAAIDTGVQRAQMEHAIAVLVGLTPAALTIAPSSDNLRVPSMPSSAPSQCLERRPDIAAAERRVASANEQIGVARAAFFPAVTLSANGGFRGVIDLLSKPNRYWSLGSAAAAPIFDAGLRKAQLDEVSAVYDQNVADYRQTVLAGFQAVEDNLSALRILAQETSAQDVAVRAARESERVAIDEYKAGTQNYLNVIIAEATALTDEQNALAIIGKRLTASVQLIQALGGGW